ncbi:MAG: BatA domain-containing protein [Opitutaceae bacterium]|nr:BatA domain-containing protein [Opitutaceae bacterium]
MSFLTPLFLLGGLAVVGPILYHLIRRTTRERTIFSSLMFLLPSPPRISKRHRLEHILLLILRCAALALLALGFARPFFKQVPLDDPTSTQPKRTVLLIDLSASMRRDGAWPAARERAEAVLRRAGPTDHVAIFTFERQTAPLLSFEDWNRAAPTERVPLALSRLQTISPGWGGTHLGNALIMAAEALAESETKGVDGRPVRAVDGPREIVLVSDLQAGSRLDTLQAYEWPKGVTLLVEAVKAKLPTNAGLQLVADAADAPRGADAVVRVRVTNAPDSKREEFKVGWSRGAAAAEYAGAPIPAYVPPGQSRVFSVPVPKEGATAAQIALTGDDEVFDNTIFVIPPVQQRAGVLWLGADTEDDVKQPLFFLRKVFMDTPRLAVKVVARAANSPVPPTDFAAASVIFVGEPLPPATIAEVRNQVQAGKVAVVVPRNAAAGDTLARLLGADGVRLTDAQPSTYAMLSEIDFRHPLFAPFADPRFSDFTKIHVWRYRKLDPAAVPNARVVAKFDSGDPAVVEVPLGKGRVFVLTSGWQPEDSQLAVSSKFVPLMWSFLEMSGSVAPVVTQYYVGDNVPLPAEAGSTAVKAPDGTSAALATGAAEFAATRQPGIYEFTGAKPQRFAVNLDANESRTAPLDPDELQDLGVPVAKVAAAPTETRENKALLQGLEAENRQKLWRWFIVATLAVLLVESALAGWTARRATLRTEEATI